MLKNKIKQMEEGHLNLEKEHQKLKREYEIDKKKTQNPPSHLPEGFALQDAASPMANHGMGKVFCDRRDICNECEHIQNPTRHFIENVFPIIQHFKGDLNEINKTTITMPDENDCKTFSVELNEDPFEPKIVVKHFETCHLCYRFWNQPFRMDRISDFIEYGKFCRNKKGSGKR